MTISKYSFGIGDRFAHEGVNQLKALIKQRQRTTPARVFLCQWQKRKLIQPLGNDHYQKKLKTKNLCSPQSNQ